MESFVFFCVCSCLCRLSLQSNPLNPLESFLEQLGRPGILAAQSYLTVLWVSWAPRVSRVSRALSMLEPSSTHCVYTYQTWNMKIENNLVSSSLTFMDALSEEKDAKHISLSTNCLVKNIISRKVNEFLLSIVFNHF